jgi:hypothetical protein
MPYAIIFIGLVFLITSFNGHEHALFTRIEGDFTGPKSFAWWFLSIAIIGGIGYVPGLKPVSNAFLALVILVLFLSNKGIFAQFNSAIKAGTTTAPQNSSAATAGFLESIGGGSSVVTQPTVTLGFPEYE